MTIATTNGSVPATLRKLIEQRTKQRAETKRAGAVSNLQSYAEWTKQETERLKNAEKEAAQEVENWAEALLLLKQHRVKHTTYSYTLDISVETTQKQLVKVYRAIGRLDGAHVEKEIADAEKNLIRISLKSVKYPNVRVSYIRKLKATDKCRIEVVKREDKQLVCERKVGS